MAAAIRAQPPAKARRPGATEAFAQPGMVARGTCWYFASADRGGAGQTGQIGDGGGCRPPQPARARIANSRGAGARKMWVIYIEMGVALAVLILIVWWTRPVKRTEEAPKDDAPR